MFCDVILYNGFFFRVSIGDSSRPIPFNNVSSDNYTSVAFICKLSILPKWRILRRGLPSFVF